MKEAMHAQHTAEKVKKNLYDLIETISLLKQILGTRTVSGFRYLLQAHYAEKCFQR